MRKTTITTVGGHRGYLRTDDTWTLALHIAGEPGYNETTPEQLADTLNYTTLARIVEDSPDQNERSKAAAALVVRLGRYSDAPAAKFALYAVSIH